MIRIAIYVRLSALIYNMYNIDLQYVQCISLLVRGESRDSHLYQQGPNGGP